MIVDGKNLYEILGVGIAATTEEITATYKKLAMKWHPDRNKDNVDHATQIFKHISEAYTILTDVTKRSVYDLKLKGCDVREPHYNHDPFGFGFDPFRSRRPSWSQPPPKKAPIRGSNINQRENIDVAQSIYGCALVVDVKEEYPCPNCNHILKKYAKKQCYWCHGAGIYGRRKCHCLKDDAKTEMKPCTVCAGTGIKTIHRKYEVKIPAGIKKGRDIRLKGNGYPSDEDGGVNGDVIISIGIEAPAGWIIEGLDLSSNLNIPCTLAYIGGVMNFVLPSGKNIDLTIPPNTPANKVFKLTGEGLLDGETNMRGNVLLNPVITLPNGRRKLKSVEIAVLRKLIDPMHMTPAR